MEPRPTLTLDVCWRIAMERAAAASFPNEACGILIGVQSEDGWRVVDVLDARNTSSKDPTQFFEIDPKALFEAHRAVRVAEDARKVVGYYHSHPTSEAVPSAYDRAQAHEADKVWVILGGHDASGQVVDQTSPVKDASSIWDIKAWVSGHSSALGFGPVVIC